MRRKKNMVSFDVATATYTDQAIDFGVDEFPLDNFQDHDIRDRAKALHVIGFAIATIDWTPDRPAHRSHLGEYFEYLGIRGREAAVRQRPLPPSKVKASGSYAARGVIAQHEIGPAILATSTWTESSPGTTEDRLLVLGNAFSKAVNEIEVGIHKARMVEALVRLGQTTKAGTRMLDDDVFPPSLALGINRPQAANVLLSSSLIQEMCSAAYA